MAGDEDRRFSVVEFTSEGCNVSIVPSSWVLHSKKECLWPPLMRGSSVMDLVRACSEPGQGWKSYPANILARCKTYKKASKKLVEAEENSCVENTDAGEHGDTDTPVFNRSTLKRTLPTLSPSRIGARSQSLPRRSPPQQPVSKRRLFEPLENSTPLVPRSSPTQQPAFLEIPEDSSSPLLENGSPKEPASKRRQLETTRSSMSTYEREHMRVLLEVRFELRQLKDQGASIVAMQQQLLARMADLEQAQRHPDLPAPPAIFVLPLSTMADFEMAETRLANPADQAVLKEQLSSLGGKTLVEAARRTMERLMRKKVQVNFSVCGRRGQKRAFRGTHMCSVAVAIITSQVAAKMVDVERAIGDYLAGAPDREGGRAERMAKKFLDQAILSAQPNDPPGNQPSASGQGAGQPISLPAA
ncbi:uncharacterized protein ISCGN_023876 [Ixodes scapularis]